MLSEVLLLLANSLLFSLRLSGGGSFPKPLSAAEERGCLARMAQGDLEARNTLVEHNLRLVAHIVKKYYTPNGDQEDLLSIGTIGLIKAISSFDASKGARLATYAARCIENAIRTPARLSMCAATCRKWCGRGHTRRSASSAPGRSKKADLVSAAGFGCTHFFGLFR